MGLDMYLTANRYISAWGHSKTDETKLFNQLLTNAGVDLGDVATPSGEIEFHIGYWRKANQIHSWFVQNVQDGKDECVRHFVHNDKLRELRKTCEFALDHPKRAEDILTPKDGFFFGSMEVDNYYFDDLRDTIKIIDKCLSFKYKDWRFFYQSSW